jgi:hypothetical protein
VKRHLVGLVAGSAASIAAGVACIYPPAGLIAAGVEGLAVAYVLAYLEARRP